MLKKYRIRSLYVPEMAYYLFVSEYNPITKLWYSVPDKYFIHITQATACRFVKFATYQPDFKWLGDTVTFTVSREEKVLNSSENDVLPEETERIDEIVALPGYKGIGPYTEEEIQPILAYLGVEDDVPTQ